MKLLLAYFRSLSPEQKALFESECETSFGYLKKAESLGQTLGPEKCVLIERFSNGKVSRKDLRPHDWMRIWPELKDHPPITEVA